MADEIIYWGRSSETGNTDLVADVYDPDGTLNTAGIVMGEVGVTYVFRGNFPSSQPAGEYFIRIRDDVAGTDKGQGPMGWDGAAEITLVDRMTSRKILQNDHVTDPDDGSVTVLDDDGGAYLTGTAYNDKLTATPYDGTDGVNHRTRLT